MFTLIVSCFFRDDQHATTGVPKWHEEVFHYYVTSM